MKNIKKFGGTAFSLAVLLTVGCASRPYTQTQLGYSNTSYNGSSHIDLLCTRARGGAKIGKEKKEEFRLGAEVCYGKLPSSSSKKTYSVDVPIVGEQKAEVQSATKNSLVKISIPFFEYKYGTLGGNFPGDGPARVGLRSFDAKDVSLGMWATIGYSLDLAVSETDYITNSGSLDNIPGVQIKGRFYGELTNELTLFGRAPFGMSIRIDEDGKVMPFFFGGYRIQW